MLISMVKRGNTKGLTIIARLAEQLGVDLKNAHCAVATDRHEAVARFSDGSLEVRLTSLVRPTVRIESPRSPGIYIELVDHQRDIAAPEGAIYRIKAYMPDSAGRNGGDELNGEVYSVYIGKQGILLDDLSKRSILEQSELLKK